MNVGAFRTDEGTPVTAVTADEMRDVDRVAVEDVGLELLQMMENAGRGLAANVRAVATGPVLVVAGNGGNGGGGLACARHLHNRGVSVRVALDRPPAELSGAAAHQHAILEATDVPVGDGVEAMAAANVVVDALVGYGLAGELRGPARELALETNRHEAPVVSLDVPSGLDATTGERPGVAVQPDRTVTLALPKTGLEADPPLVLADIGIPPTVYERLGLEYATPFDREDWVRLRS